MRGHQFLMTNWHQFDPRKALEKLGSDASAGLSEAEAARRLSDYGPNELAGSGIKRLWRVLWEQLTEVMVVILIFAAAISALLRDYNDAIAIAAIIVLNALLGFSQEYRAEKAMAALKKLAVPSVRVRRDGDVRETSALTLVPGDIVLLEAGNLVAADCRVIESVDLQTQEATLTGESQPVRKIYHALAPPDLALGDRRNMAYMGTFISSGRGEGVVTATGMQTELGRIAGMIQGVKREPTPLQQRLSQLGKVLAAAALFIVVLIFVLGWLRGEDFKLLFMTAVSLAVAAVPEGLPAVMTIALTLGAQRMLRRRVLIRKLSAVETLGAVTVICSDKTGTLTENRMTTAVLQLPDRKIEWSSEGLEINRLPEAEQAEVKLLLAAGALCNDAVVHSAAGPLNSSAPLGDPTEIALVVVAAQAGMAKAELDAALPRVAEVAFTSERKRMTTVHRIPSDRGVVPPGVAAACKGISPAYLAFTKGAVDVLLERSSAVWVQGRRETLDPAWRERLAAAQDALAADGMRVLGVAFRCLDSTPAKGDTETLERDLTFAGMVGMIDPARPEAASAVATCKAAGIRPVMITGDYPLTARYIAGQLAIAGAGPVLTGAQLSRISNDELEEVVESAAVYARVSPEHKLRIVEGLHRRGEVVAMTGDGVNDAPALKQADIGVAMGIAGSDVAKESADLVLLDDNFASIVAAVEEGRVIYDNIRKFIKYMLATNSGEIWLMVVTPFFGMPLPLLPLQILWMNLVTDGLPALALGVEPAEADTMRRPPRPPEESLFARGLGRHIIWVGFLMGLLSLGVGYGYWRVHDPRWQTMVFTTLTLSQMAHVMAIRSERQSLFQIGLMSNRPLLGAASLTVILQLALVYVPFLQGVFGTRALPAADLALAVAASSVIFWAVELEKRLVRRRPVPA